MLAAGFHDPALDWQRRTNVEVTVVVTVEKVGPGVTVDVDLEWN